MTPETATYPRYRFPAEIISYAVWLYHVFGLSLRDVELILSERGITVSHESVRQWCLKFGADLARKLRQRRPKPGDTWHLGASCKTLAPECQVCRFGGSASAMLRDCPGIARYSAASERFWVTSGKPMATLPRNGGKALMSCLGANALR
jgi:hypothetical protein